MSEPCPICEMGKRIMTTVSRSPQPGVNLPQENPVGAAVGDEENSKPEKTGSGKNGRRR